MINARFFITAPKEVNITLQLSATADQWAAVANHLALAQGGSEPNLLARQIQDAIRFAEKPLYSERWTTGYATGESEGEEKK